jgi:glycerophosphoryl diester phosphodiesterase
MTSRSPRILGHRGASGHLPENSLAAFREAARLGADGSELDVHASADGALVIHHDPTLPDLGPIATLRLAEIRAYRLPNGEPIPTLAEALDVLAGQETWIEIKGLPPALDADLLGVIRSSRSPERCGIHSFDHRIVARLGERQPGLRLGVLSASYPLDPAAPMVAAGALALWQSWQLVDRELVDAVHRKGGEVIAWTVNDAETGRRLADLGVDALCGNFPERLRTR